MERILCLEETLRLVACVCFVFVWWSGQQSVRVEMVKKREEMAYVEGECSLYGLSGLLHDVLKLVKHLKRKCYMVKRKSPFCNKLLAFSHSPTSNPLNYC